MLFDFASLTPIETYKLLAATVVPRPIAWVVTQALDGSLNAAPYSFFNVLSGDPPVVAIGIGGRSADHAQGHRREHPRHRPVRGQPGQQRHGGGDERHRHRLPARHQRAARGRVAHRAEHRVRPPRIDGSPVALECEHLQTLDVAPDRAIVLGRVVAMHIVDAAVRDEARCYVDTAKLDLIGRMGGAAGYTRTRDAFEVPRIRVDDWVPRASE